MKLSNFLTCSLSLCLLSGPAMGGHLYYLRDGSSDLGLYKLDPLTGKSSQVNLATGTTVGKSGLTETGHPFRLFFAGPGGGLREISIDSGKTTNRGGDNAEGLGFDPVSNTLYGSLFTGEFFTINTSTGLRSTNLASPPNPVLGLAVLNGVVYGLESAVHGDKLYSYDPIANSWAVVGGTGYLFPSPGLAADPDRNVLYAIGVAGSTMLYQINPATAAASPIGDAKTGGNGGGLAFISFSQPDVSISVSTGKSVGEGVFSPANQYIRLNSTGIHSRTSLQIKITSVNRNDQFAVRPLYNRRGLRGSTFRTNEGKIRTTTISNGLWRTPVLAKGESIVIYAAFRWRFRSTRKQTFDLRVKATSNTDHTLTDSAGLKINQSPSGR